jgi:hypothetical protein
MKISGVFMSGYAICLLSIAVCSAGEAIKGSSHKGEWFPEKSFTHINIACFRKYNCDVKESWIFAADQKKVSNPPFKQVTGVCSADGGAIDSCNTCLSNPPKEQCEVHLEKR